MNESGLAEIIINQIDFRNLQNEVLEVVCLILGKKEISSEDVQILQNSLSLWVVILIKNEFLIEDFYNYKRTE